MTASTLGSSLSALAPRIAADDRDTSLPNSSRYDARLQFRAVDQAFTDRVLLEGAAGNPLSPHRLSAAGSVDEGKLAAFPHSSAAHFPLPAIRVVV